MMEINEWNVHKLEKAGQLDVDRGDSIILISKELGYNGRSGFANLAVDKGVFFCSDCNVEVDWYEFRVKADVCDEHEDELFPADIGGSFNGP